jgi:hypothetical protein
MRNCPKAPSKIPLGRQRGFLKATTTTNKHNNGPKTNHYLRSSQAFCQDQIMSEPYVFKSQFVFMGRFLC